MDSDWYLFKDLKRRPFQSQNWVPLRALDYFRKIGQFGDTNYLRDTFACGSVAIPLDAREFGNKLGWSDIGLIHETRPYAGEDGYKPADKFLLNWSEPEPSGVSLVISQGFGFDRPAVWHLHQDLVVALNLLREGDTWIRPEEDYIDVVRLHRNDEGDPRRIEIRTEFLRDYLKARRMALRLAWYRDRDSVLADASHIAWRDNPPAMREDNYRFEARFQGLHEGTGMPIGGKSAVFKARRTDIDPEDDVPEFGPETDDNIESESYTYEHSGVEVCRVEGEIWAQEWIEPSEFSPRVAYDNPPSAASFIVDSSGTRESADALDDEDIGKYLWFRPNIVNDILRHRDGSINWYTRYTGSIQITQGYATHFGLNDAGLLNAYAYDVAKLPEWQRLIWQGNNVAPDGGVCRELLAAQMEVSPAGTHAPEKHVATALQDINKLFVEKFGERLFREHAARSDILKFIHRFRAVEPNGLLDLAKDVTRIIIEDIDVKALHRVCQPPNDEARGSLKSLERLIAKELTDEAAAADLMSLMHAIYELRGMTSHLPSSIGRDPLTTLAVRKDAPPVEQGRQMLNSVMYFLAELARQLYNSE